MKSIKRGLFSKNKLIWNIGRTSLKVLLMSPEFKLYEWTTFFWASKSQRSKFFPCWIILCLLEKGVIPATGCWRYWLAYRKAIGTVFPGATSTPKNQPNLHVTQVLFCVQMPLSGISLENKSSEVYPPLGYWLANYNYLDKFSVSLEFIQCFWTMSIIYVTALEGRTLSH